VLVAAGLALAATPALAHPCDADAVKRAEPLLRLHFADNASGKVENLAVDDKVRQLAPVKALKGKGRFDVLEVYGHIYKSDYRMRFLYAQIPGSCVLMGQEILEASDPY